MAISVQTYKMLDLVDPSLRSVLMAILEEIERQQKERVTKDEFRELKGIVAQLAEAQKRTEDRLEKLAEAQRRTEERLDSLSLKVEQLAEAQRRTEARVEELAEAQKRTEDRLEKLAEAQMRTEEEVRKLAKGLSETRKMVGGLSDTVGYGLEDRAINRLPYLVEERFGIVPKERFVRKYITILGKDVELNVFGTGEKDGKKWFIVGEGKARLSKKDVDRFLRLLDTLKTAGVTGEHVLPILVTYSTRPQVQEYAEDKGIEVVWSYELGA